MRCAAYQVIALSCSDPWWHAAYGSPRSITTSIPQPALVDIDKQADEKAIEAKVASHPASPALKAFYPGTHDASWAPSVGRLSREVCWRSPCIRAPVSPCHLSLERTQFSSLT